MRATTTFCVPASARTLKLGLSRLVEFKAALDRIRGSRGSIWKRIPQAFKEFLQQRATRTQAIHTDKKIG